MQKPKKKQSLSNHHDDDFEFPIENVKSKEKENAMNVAENWIERHLQVAGSELFQFPSSNPEFEAYLSQEVPKRTHVSMAAAGINRQALYRLGLPQTLVDRLYRALYVYSSGFHTLLKDVSKHCKAFAKAPIKINLWMAFLILLEQCEDGKYEMTMSHMIRETAEWKIRTDQKANEVQRLYAQEMQEIDAKRIEMEKTFKGKDDIISTWKEKWENECMQVCTCLGM